MPSETLLTVDVSSHQPPNRASLDTWVGQGCEVLIVKAYSSFERPGLEQTTRDWLRIAAEANVTAVPYCWLWRAFSPARVVGEALALVRAEGLEPGLLFLDCETYDDGNYRDPGPTAEQIAEAVGECRSQGVNAAIYSGAWWLHGHLEGDRGLLAGLPVWLADYSRHTSLEALSANPPLGLDVIGHQYTSTPVDWSRFWRAKLDALLAGPVETPEEPDETAVLRETVEVCRIALDDVAGDRLGVLLDQLSATGVLIPELTAIHAELARIREQALGPR